MILMDNEDGELSGKGSWIRCGFLHLDVRMRENSVYWSDYGEESSSKLVLMYKRERDTSNQHLLNVGVTNSFSP